MPLSKFMPFKKGSYTSLLICLLVTMVGLPLFEHSPLGRMLLSIWFFLTSGVLLVSISGTGIKHCVLKIAGAIFCFLVLGNLVIQAAGWSPTLFQMIAMPYGLVFLVLVVALILSSIFKADQVTPDLVSGAVVAYLLLGICWGGLYSLIELVQPGSFSFGEGGRELSSLFYFSFVTLTTLGYGDILPVAKIARTAAYLEAVTGVMFTAILIAGLVGNIRLRRIASED